MRTIDRAQIQDLMKQAESLDRGPAQAALLEEAVRLADLLRDVPLGYETRMKLIEAAPSNGAPDRALVAFTWCLAQYDRDPENYPVLNLLWKYRWLIAFLHAFPQISRQQIFGALDDLRERILRAGFAVEAYEQSRIDVKYKLGDDFDYLSEYNRCRRSQLRELSPCATCLLGGEVDYLAEAGRDEEALIKARPILEGTWRCHSYPQRTHARVLVPLLRMGRGEEAMTYHQKGYRLIARDRYYLYEVAKHIDFLLLTNNLARALKLFETHFPWFEGTADFEDRCCFAMSSRFLFDRLASADRTTLKLRLSPKFPLFQESGRYSTLELRDWFGTVAVEIVGRFNTRNGNDFYSRRYRQHLDLASLITPIPLRRSARAKTEARVNDEQD